MEYSNQWHIFKRRKIALFQLVEMEILFLHFSADEKDGPIEKSSFYLYENLIRLSVKSIHSTVILLSASFT